jgi:uncharacterized membrane protein (DUF106 family)
VGILNATLTKLFNVVFFPLKWMGPMGALTVVSVLVGAFLVWLFGKTSNQDAIGVVRDRIRGNMIGVRLFGDNLGNLMRLQGRIVRDNLIYMKHALIPLLVLIVPVALILVQLDLRYVARPLEPGERAVVNVTVSDPTALKSVQLDVPQGVTVETPGVRIKELLQVSWRIRADEPGRYELSAKTGGSSVEKELLVGTDWGAVSRNRTGAGFLSKLLHPGESPISRSEAVESFEVLYPRLDLSLFGWGMNWLIFFFVVSIIGGFLLRKPLGVEI